MSEWVWVALGYGVTFGAFAGYILLLNRRRARVTRRQEKPR